MDIIKGIAIIMIVNVHLVGGAFFSIGSTFHVIAFFFAAGVVHGFNAKWETLPFKKYIKQKFFRLLYPYLTLSACYIGFRICLNLVREGSFIDVVVKDSLIRTATLEGVGTLWFLPVLFLGDLLFFIAHRFKLRDWLILSLGIASVFVSAFLNAYGICGKQWYGNHSWFGLLVNRPVSMFLSGSIAMLFIEGGYLSYKARCTLFTNNPIRINQVGWLCFTMLLSLVLDWVLLDYYTGDIHKLDIGNPWIYLICSLAGLLFVTTLSKLIRACFKSTPLVLPYFGRNSLIIMTTHSEYFINSIAYLLVTGVISMAGLSVTAKVVSGLSLVVIMLLEIGIIFIVNHSVLKYLYHCPVESGK